MTNLIDNLISNINLPEFIEEECGIDIKWSNNFNSAQCMCPLHNEKDPSLRINYRDGVWVFHCFGCSESGTIIHFCQKLKKWDFKQTIKYLCEKYNIKSGQIVIKNYKVKNDSSKKIENANILTSNQCRILLRKDFEKHKDWVMNSYKEINKALEDNDIIKIEQIGNNASRRILC